MTPPEEAGTTQGDRAEGGDRDSRQLMELVETVLEQLAEIRSNLERLVSINLDRARVGLRDGLGRLLLWSWMTAAVLALTAAAAVLAATGLTGALTAWLELPGWAGNLLGGGLLLAAIWTGLHLRRAGRDRAEKRRMVRKYEYEKVSRPTAGAGS